MPRSALRIVQYYPGALEGELGTAGSVRGWCSALAKTGATVRLIVDDAVVNMPEPPGVDVVAIPHIGSGRLRRPRSLASHLSGADVLVLAGGGTLANITAGREARSQGVPYVVTSHGVYAPAALDRKRRRKRAWMALMERRYLSSARAVHVFFAEEFDGLASRGFDVPAVVVPSGYEAPGDVAWCGEGEYLLWLGRFDVECKGLDLLVAALALLDDGERPDVRLHGPDFRGGKASVARLVTEHGLERWVTIGEAVYGDAKWSLLVDAAGLVHPSRWDACPGSVLEAASVGLPTLVTPFALGRMLGDRGGAFVVDANAESLADGLQQLRRPASGFVGRRGAQLVASELAWDVVAHSWRDHVEPLLGANGARS